MEWRSSPLVSNSPIPAECDDNDLRPLLQESHRQSISASSPVLLSFKVISSGHLFRLDLIQNENGCVLKDVRVDHAER